MRYLVLAALAAAMVCAPSVRAQVGPCSVPAWKLAPDRSPPSLVKCPSEVDLLATLRPLPLPRYPALLMAAGVEGQVMVQFVVDQRGHVDSNTIHWLRSTQNLFSDAVRAAIIHWSGSAARMRGRPVAQWNEVEIDFQAGECDRPSPHSVLRSRGLLLVCSRMSAQRRQP